MNGEDTPYVRPAGYAEHYRDRRFAGGSGPATHRREQRAIRRLLRRAPSVPGPWLDAPSGAGRLTELLPGPTIQVDRDVAMLRSAPDRWPKVCASCTRLPFADDAFAGSLCLRLLHHVPTSAERVAILGELRRVTRGPIVVSFFWSVTLQHARRLLARRLGKVRSGRHAITLRRLCRDAADAGLAVAAMVPIAPFVSEQCVALLQRSEPGLPSGHERLELGGR
jgi:hypothetical protein